MEYCYQFSHLSWDRVQYHLGNLEEWFIYPLQAFSLHIRNITSLSLFYCYFHGNCPDDLLSFVPLAQTFTVNVHLVTSTLHIPKDFFTQKSFFPRTTTLWNRFSHECFPRILQNYPIQIQGQLFIYHPYPCNLHLFLLLLVSIPHISFNNTEPWMTLKPYIRWIWVKKNNAICKL